MENITINNGKGFIKELTRVSWAADSRKYAPRPNLKYVQIKGADGVITMTATDSRVLATAAVTAEFNGEFETFVNAKDWRKWNVKADASGAVVIDFESWEIAGKGGALIESTGNLSYPETSRLFPYADTPEIYNGNAGELLDKLKAIIKAGDKLPLAHVDAGELVAGNTELDGEGVNEHWTINAKNLLKVIKGTSRRANVTIKAAKTLRPGLIEIDRKTAGIVCPMRRY